jgi:hypothetical protein
MALVSGYLFLVSTVAKAPDVLMNNTFSFWNTFRDPTTGLYCDTIKFGVEGTVLLLQILCWESLTLTRDISFSIEACGAKTSNGQRFSSASVGMGLVADCAFAEMGLLSKAEVRSCPSIPHLS